jgi:hypothetical protein
VNLSKPRVSPIDWGKAGKKAEFSAKVSISDDVGFVDVDRISWNNFSESKDLIQRVEQYKKDRGFYPERLIISCASAPCRASNVCLKGLKTRQLISVSST